MQLLGRRLPRTTTPPMILVLMKRRSIVKSIQLILLLRIRSRSRKKSSLLTVKTILSITHQLMNGIKLSQPLDMMWQTMDTKQNSSIQLSPLPHFLLILPKSIFIHLPFIISHHLFFFNSTTIIPHYPSIFYHSTFQKAASSRTTPLQMRSYSLRNNNNLSSRWLSPSQARS